MKTFEIFLKKEKEIRKKYNDQVRNLSKEFEEKIKTLEEGKKKELEDLKIQYPDAINTLEDITPCIVWRGRRVCGNLGLEVLRLFLVKAKELKTKTKILYKKELNLFTTLKQKDRFGRVMPLEDIIKSPCWIRVEQEFPENLERWNGESDLFINDRININNDLYGEICEAISTYSEDHYSMRNRIVDLLIKSGIEISIDPLIIDKKLTKKQIDDSNLEEEED